MVSGELHVPPTMWTFLFLLNATTLSHSSICCVQPDLQLTKHGTMPIRWLVKSSSDWRIPPSLIFPWTSSFHWGPSITLCSIGAGLSIFMD